MWRLLSGIALILLLDIAFIFLMTSETEGPEIARAVGPAAAYPVIHEQPAAPPQAIDDSLETVESDEYVRETENFRARKRHANRSLRRFGNRSAAVSATAPTKLFQDTIIWIGRTEVPVKIEGRDSIPIRTETRVTGDIQADVIEQRPVKKRSFQSKTIGVIKKPYDLMKAFVDRFN